jgi:hypothetical protein
MLVYWRRGNRGVFCAGKGHRPHLEEDGARSRVDLDTWLRGGVGGGWKIDEGLVGGELGDGEDDFEVKGGRGMAGDLAVELAGILGEEVRVGGLQVELRGGEHSAEGRARNLPICRAWGRGSRG